VAVAMPVALVDVFAEHSRLRSAGTVNTGGIVSFTVIVWIALVVCPHSSATVQVRETTLVPAQPLLTRSL
jgi:hypothetical protein